MERIEVLKHIENYQNELTLVIKDPKRRVFFDKWMNEISKANKYAKENNAKLIMICKSKKTAYGDEELDKLIFWCNGLFSILPDHIIYNDILIEIDINFKELKTNREKNIYGKNLIFNILQVMVSLENLLESHPEYNSKEKENYKEEIHQLTLEKLKSEKNKYVIQSYYIQIGKLISVLGEILVYVQDLKKEINDEIILENEVATLTADRHRLVLLKEIGVFEFLLEKYMYDKTHKMSLEVFSTLIVEIIGASSKNLRSDIGRLKNEILSPKINKVVQSNNTTDHVNSFLASIGLSV